MKRLVISILVIVFSVSVFLSGCGKNADNSAATSGDKSSVEASTAAETNSNYTKAGEFPIVKEKVNLKIFTIETDIAHPVKDSWFTKWYEEKTNIQIDWETSPPDGFVEKRNIIIASGDVPDIFANAWYPFSYADEAKYVDQKMLLELSDLIDKNGIEIKKMFDSDSSIKKSVSPVEGKIYTLPDINDCFHCKYYGKVWYNKTLLDKLGLPVPTTTAEFEDTLKAIKAKDSKLIPFTGCKTGSLFTEPITFLMSAFQFNSWDMDNMPLLASVVDGKLSSIVDTAGYKEGLKFVSSLWSQGLIYKESFTMDDATLIKLNNTGEKDIGKIVFAAGPHKSYYSGWDSTDKIWQNYHVLKPLTGPNGYRSTSYIPYDTIRTGTTAITTSCKEPEAALRLLDWLYSEEGTLAANYGREGTEWSKPDAGTLGLNGKPAIWKVLSPVTTDTAPFTGVAATWNQRFGASKSEAFRLGQQVDIQDPYTYTGADSNAPVEKLLYDATAQIKDAVPANESVLPKLYYGPVISDEQQKLKMAIGEYIKETRVKLVVGKVDFDAEWDKYVANLKSLGLDKYIATAQTAYDAQYKK